MVFWACVWYECRVMMDTVQLRKLNTKRTAAGLSGPDITRV